MVPPPKEAHWKFSPGEHPRLKPKLQVLDVIALAFCTSSLVYLGLIAAGVLTPVEPPDLGFPIVWLLTLVTAMEIPTLFLLGIVLMNQAEVAPDFETAWSRCQTAVLVMLAFAEAIGILGLVAVLFGEPAKAGYGFVALSLFLMILITLLFRPRVIAITSARLAAEERPTQ